MRISLRTVIIIVLATLSAGCARPTSTECFLKASDKSADGLYHFLLDLSDSLNRYDVSFYSRIDCNNIKAASVRNFPMTVTWTAPSGQKYNETVYFDFSAETDGSDFYTRQYLLPYWLGITPVEWGEWDLAVRVDADRFVPGFRGIGVVCAKTE